MLNPLAEAQIVALLQRALADKERGLGEMDLRVSDDVLRKIAAYSSGDARAAYNVLEVAAATAVGHAGESKDAPPEITDDIVRDALQKRVLLYDKAGEEHFNLISALHKSVRSSDPDAALYWLTRMLEAGEDRLYLARRLVRMAIEDISLADPRALEQAVAAMQAVHFLGIPEGDLALAQAAIYLSVAPKSDAAYRAMNDLRGLVESSVPEPVPLQLRNAPTRLMKDMGYSQGYRHAHEFEDAITDMECLPPSLAGKQFYFPSDRGVEKRIAERLDEIRKAKQRMHEKT
jgi:putative ATPase